MATIYIPSASGWQATGGGAGSTCLRVKITQSYDALTNKSAITAQLQVRNEALKLTWNSINDYYRSFRANGHSLTLSDAWSVQTQSDATWRTLSNGSETGLSYTLSHAADGSATVSVNVNLYLYATYGGTEYHSIFANLSGSAALQNYPSYKLTLDAGTGAEITVRRTASAAGAATGALSDGAAIYCGDTLKVGFSASTGYQLGTHTVNGSSFTSGGTHTVSGNVSVKATATPASYFLSVLAADGVTIGVKRGSESLHNGSMIRHGDKLTITFKAATGYKLTSHTVNGTSFTSGNTHTVGGAVTVAAEATVLSYKLTVTAGTGSSATVKRTDSPLQHAGTGTITSGATVYYGDKLTISFGASEGYDLKTHTVNDAAFTSGQSHTVSGAVSVKAAANVKSFALSLTPATGTTITAQRTSSPKQGAATGTLSDGAKIYHGDVLKVSFAAKTGYVLDTHTVNGASFSSGNTHTVTKAVTVATTGHAGPSTISSLTPTSVQTRQTLSLSVSRVSTAYYHKARFLVGSTVLATSSAFAQELSYTVPRSWFASYPSSTSLTVTVSVQTYTTSACTTAVGSPATRAVTVTADSGMKPTLQSGFASVAPDNSGYSWSSSITGYVQGYSKAAVTMTKSKVTMAEGATLASYKVTCQGKTQTVTSPGATATATTEALTGAAATAIKVTVTDSRGRTASTTLTVTPMAYAKPTISGVKVFRCDSGGTETDGGTHYSVTATGSCSTLGGQNEVTLTARRYSADRSRSWSANLGSGEPPVSVQGRVLGGTLVEDNSYILRITATDLLGNATYTEIKLPGLRWAMKFRPGGTGVGFGMAPSRDKVLQIPDDWDVLIGQLGLVYRAGDSVTFGTGSYVQLPGGFRANNRLQFTIPLSKPIVSGVTASVSGKIVLYRDGTFATITIGTGNSAETFLSASGVSVRLTFTDVPSFYSAHSWCGVQAYGLTVSFS